MWLSVASDCAGNTAIPINVTKSMICFHAKKFIDAMTRAFTWASCTVRQPILGEPLTVTSAAKAFIAPNLSDHVIMLLGSQSPKSLLT